MSKKKKWSALAKFEMEVYLSDGEKTCGYMDNSRKLELPTYPQAQQLY